MANSLIILIKFYKYFLSPIFVGQSCRFYPSCSTYAIESIKQHNFLYAFFLSIKRILKCNPWCQGGFDPVPEK
ncbi:membrane protein insertion efficiency factor YidD [Gammaproteobacteria bacterium]|nr:membrane protein insertion efficiency factor YidD [Gammaproteobacteria bacterium]